MSLFIPAAVGANRAAASGRLRADQGLRADRGLRARGRLRTDQACACADQYSKQQFYNTIYFNTFIKQFLMFRSPAFSSQFSCKFLVNNSFSTTISSVNFIGKSIPLPFQFFPSCAKSVQLLFFFSMNPLT